MRSRLPFLVIITFIFLSLDFFNLGGLDQLSKGYQISWLVPCYLLLSLLSLIGVYAGITQFGVSALKRGPFLNWMIGFGLVMAVVRLLLSVLLFLQDIWRFLAGGLGRLGVDYFDISDGSFLPERNLLYLTITVCLVLIPLIAMLYGISVGKYKYSVEPVTMSFPDLPRAFDGFRLLQVSDIHAGSWDSIERVQRGIKMIQDQKADMIVFTGDIVNVDKDEIDPYIDLFAGLEAPFGKYAILGNHDYYGQPRDAALRPAYYEDFFDKFKRMGWDLILNENRTITKEDGAIKLLGVENWGEGKYFPKRGELDEALAGVKKDDFSILLSHDPTHWDQKVKHHQQHIPLTLSGHTHGMQFGLNFKYLKWSPVQYRYRKWMGLYEELGQKLYVNRGFGYLAFPGRVGMWPEITVITLKKGMSS